MIGVRVSSPTHLCMQFILMWSIAPSLWHSGGDWEIRSLQVYWLLVLGVSSDCLAAGVSCPVGPIFSDTAAFWDLINDFGERDVNRTDGRSYRSKNPSCSKPLFSKHTCEELQHCIQQRWVNWNITWRIWRLINILLASHITGLILLKQLCWSQGDGKNGTPNGGTSSSSQEGTIIVEQQDLKAWHNMQQIWQMVTSAFEFVFVEIMEVRSCHSACVASFILQHSDVKIYPQKYCYTQLLTLL